MGGPYFLGAGPLLIDSASASYFLNGNVGIGRSDPAHALDIVGNVRLLNQGTLFWRNAANDSDWGEITFWSDNSLYLGFNAANVRVRTGGEVRLTVDASGNVGIGTLSPAAKLHVAGDVLANNSIKVYDSGWFQVSPLNEYQKTHGLSALPKSVTVLCGPSATPGPTDQVSAVGPSVAHWHDWGGSDFGAFVRMDQTSIWVRAGTYVGWHSGQWRTSGYYKVIAWA